MLGGSGPDGQIRANDVLTASPGAAMAAGAPSAAVSVPAAASTSFVDLPLSNMRQVSVLRHFFASNGSVATHKKINLFVSFLRHSTV